MFLKVGGSNNIRWTRYQASGLHSSDIIEFLFICNKRFDFKHIRSYDRPVTFFKASMKVLIGLTLGVKNQSLIQQVILKCLCQVEDWQEKKGGVPRKRQQVAQFQGRDFAHKEVTIRPAAFLRALLFHGNLFPCHLVLV